MQPFKQSNKYTNGAAGLLVILNHFNSRFRLTKPNEFEIWHRSALLPLKISDVFALATIAKKNGLQPRVVVGKSECEIPGYRFKGYTLDDVKEAQYLSRLFYQKARGLKVEVQVCDFDLAFARSFLFKGNVLLLRLNSALLHDADNASSLVPVFGYSNNKYLIVDTIKGEKRLVADQEMEDAFASVTIKCKEDPRMIVL